MKKILVFLLIATMSLSVFAACGGSAPAEPAPAPAAPAASAEAAPAAPAPEAPAGKMKIAVSLPPANNAWQAKMLDVVTEESKKFADFEFTIKNAVDDNDQLNQLNIFKNDNYDLIMVLPGNGTLLTPICEEIFDAGIPTVILDRAIESDKYTAFVAGDNRSCGVNAAKYIGEFLGGKGDIVALHSYTGIPIDVDRFNGFVDTLKSDYPDIKILVEGDGEFNREAGLAAMTNILPAYPHIDAVYTQDDEAALGALNAIETAQRTDIKLITGMGGTKVAYEKFLENNPDDIYKASMSYFPSQGADGVQICVAILKGESYPKDTILPSQVVTAENAAQFMGDAY